MTSSKADLIPKVPMAIDEQLLSIKDDSKLDDKIHIYLNNLIPDIGGNFEEREEKMVNELPASLKQYYLIRRLEWGIPWDGVTDFFMQNGFNGLHLIPEGIEALRTIGAEEHAELLEEVIPIVMSEFNKFEEAEKNNTIDLVYTDEYIYPLDPYNEKWDNIEFDLFKARMNQIRNRPAQFLHKQ